MTDDERALDKASKQSALAVLGLAAVTSVALFGPPFFMPLVAIPLWAVGVLQRLTERPWLIAGAVAWGAALAAVWRSPFIGVAAAAGGYFFVRHWLLHQRLRKNEKALKP
jgi:hypothetical protein